MKYSVAATWDGTFKTFSRRGRAVDFFIKKMGAMGRSTQRFFRESVVRDLEKENTALKCCGTLIIWGPHT